MRLRPFHSPHHVMRYHTIHVIPCNTIRKVHNRHEMIPEETSYGYNFNFTTIQEQPQYQFLKVGQKCDIKNKKYQNLLVFFFMLFREWGNPLYIWLPNVLFFFPGSLRVHGSVCKTLYYLTLVPSRKFNKSACFRRDSHT